MILIIPDLYHSFGSIIYSCHHKISLKFLYHLFECDCLRTMYDKGRESFAWLVNAHVKFFTLTCQNMKISQCVQLYVYILLIQQIHEDILVKS